MILLIRISLLFHTLFRWTLCVTNFSRNYSEAIRKTHIQIDSEDVVNSCSMYHRSELSQRFFLSRLIQETGSCFPSRSFLVRHLHRHLQLILSLLYQFLSVRIWKVIVLILGWFLRVWLAYGCNILNKFRDNKIIDYRHLSMYRKTSSRPDINDMHFDTV